MPDSINGNDLREALAAGTRCLERCREAINALNVFPVPDGDTGTNLLLTMRAVNEETHQVPSFSAEQVASAMAKGALLGARGNSGVILSQFFLGFSWGLQGKASCNGRDLADSLTAGSKAAYAAVSKPVEGTMLTVLREMAMAAQERATHASEDSVAVWRAALEGAKTALALTPQQLPVLKAAGVVDAGGQGVVVLLEGIVGSLTGVNVDEIELSLARSDQKGVMDVPHIHQDYLTATEGERFGYCTQLIIEGQALDGPRIRERLAALADSTVVVGDDRLIKVHVHTFDPGPVLSYAVSLGAVSQVKIDNIDQQHREFVALHRQSKEALEMAVVVVAWGQGFARLFRSLGAHAVVPCGPTMNPSTEELLKAAQDAGGKETILLPNNANVVPAARLAASSTRDRAHCIPSITLPQGIAALLAFNPDAPVQKNLRAMERALGGIKTVEVTTAVRDASINGVRAEKGQLIGLLEGELIVAGPSVMEVLSACLAKAGMGRERLVTLYWGGDTGEEEAQKAAARLKEVVPGLEVEVVWGGQPFYHYIASVE